MIDVGLTGISLFAGLIVLATLAGTSLSARVEWGSHAKRCGLPLAAGIAFGPFLLGLAAIAVLLALPGRPASVHLAVIAAALAVPAVFGVKALTDGMRAALTNASRHMTIVAASVCGASALLLLLAVFTPLTQNDALEYEIVARRIFELRALTSYPMIDPASEPSGFFAPWTHPPLYPALLYVSQLAQGHADSPALERLIAPWALFAAGAVSAALARLQDGRAGGFAFLALLAPPLVFLGAAGALIDALTILGMALAMASVCAGGRDSIRSAAFTGLALGAALWAHSQAILFPPVFAAAILFRNWVNYGKFSLLHLFVTLATAAVAGVWPYVWNFQRFGALASDTQAFVAPDVLRWDSYFAIDRGISGIPAKIIYGPLKMFSAPEAYGLLFALALAGAVLSVWQMRTGKTGEAAGDGQQDRCGPALTAAALSAIYLAGVSLSQALGSSDLVKNERYLLMISPPAAILAALFLTWLAEMTARLLRRAGAGTGFFQTLFHSAVCAGFLLQVGALTAYGLGRNGLLGPALGQPFETTLSERGETALTVYLRGHTPPGSVILSLKPADMYYAQRRMISHFDPRLKEFYTAASLNGAASALARLGVSFVHLPNYAMPTLYNSWLKEILADPLRSTLFLETDSGQIYALTPALAAEVKQTNIGLEDWPWELAKGMVFGGRKRFGRVPGSFSPVSGTSVVHGGLTVSAFARHAVATLRMGAGGETKPVPATPNAEYVAKFVFSGVCHAAVVQHETYAGGAGAGSAGSEGSEGRLLATAVIEEQTSPFSLPVRFRTGPQAEGLWFELLLSGECALDIKKVEVLRYAPN